VLPAIRDLVPLNQGTVEIVRGEVFVVLLVVLLVVVESAAGPRKVFRALARLEATISPQLRDPWRLSATFIS